MSNTVQGKRVNADANKYDYGMEPGDYGQDADGIWHCITPNGLVGTLSNHSVQEHEDGTITVSPSILVWNKEERYHGFLERGIWREC